MQQRSPRSDIWFSFVHLFLPLASDRQNPERACFDAAPHRIGRDETVFPVSTEESNFVFNNISTGEFAAEFGGSTEVEIAGVWSMGQLPPGKKGITGKGQLGHAFPRISPEEAQHFNRLEIQRIQGSSTHTIEMFNRRLDAVSMQVYFETAE